MKKSIFFVLFLFLILFSVNAVSIKINMGDSDNKIFFKPGLHKEFNLIISEAERIATVPLKLDGDLAAHAKITPVSLSLRPGEAKEAKLVIDLPKELSEGIHYIKVSATEIPVDASDAAFVLMPAVGASIKVINTKVDYDCYVAVGKAVMGSNKINVVLNAGNNGNKPIQNAVAEFELYDKHGSMLTSWKTKPFSIPSFDSITQEIPAPLNNVAPDYYELKGFLSCADKKIDLSQQVINHATNLKINDFKVFKKDNALRMQFDLENEFEVPVPVRGMVWFYENGKHVAHYALPNIVVKPNSQSVLGVSKKFEGLRVPAGSYKVTGELFYEGRKDSAETTVTLTDEDFARAQGEGGFSVKDQEKEQKAFIEQPSASFSINGKMIVRVLAALVIIALLILVYRKYSK